MELRCFVAVMLACVINVGVCYGADSQLRCSPLYFGPNAMPVPPMLHGRVSDRLCVEAGYDLYAGFYGDITHTLMLSAKVPLFTKRVNLSLWFPVLAGGGGVAERCLYVRRVGQCGREVRCAYSHVAGLYGLDGQRRQADGNQLRGKVLCRTFLPDGLLPVRDARLPVPQMQRRAGIQAMNVHRCQWGVPLTRGIGVRSEVALWIHMTSCTCCTGVRRFWTKAD